VSDKDHRYSVGIPLLTAKDKAQGRLKELILKFAPAFFGGGQHFTGVQE
jgi:hypothetical protein